MVEKTQFLICTLHTIFVNPFRTTIQIFTTLTLETQILFLEAGCEMYMDRSWHPLKTMRLQVSPNGWTLNTFSPLEEN